MALPPNSALSRADSTEAHAQASTTAIMKCYLNLTVHLASGMGASRNGVTVDASLGDEKMCTATSILGQAGRKA
ncbi:MAG TPA: hypothetical protein VI793_12255 [Anaerolineales bacterium]|nr:hypothetical protein [Anaerolineales bacterium]